MKNLDNNRTENISQYQVHIFCISKCSFGCIRIKNYFKISI